MTQWNLSRIRYTVRKLTGKLDTSQLPDSSDPNQPISMDNPAGIDDYINDFYLFDMPEHLRTLKLKRFYTFTTLPNIGTYRVPTNIYQIDNTVYCDNYQMSFYQDPQAFYNVWPEFDFISYGLGVGDGGQDYSFTAQGTPMLQGSITIGITPNTSPATQFETFRDSDTPVNLAIDSSATFVNPGVLTGNLGGTGTVNYLTGAITLHYANPVAQGQNINLHYRPYIASRPQGMMFFQQQFFLRAIPNDVYTIKTIAYYQPTVLLTGSFDTIDQFDDTSNGGSQGQETLFPEFWQVVAYGAAMKILKEDMDVEQVSTLMPFFEEQKNLAQRRALKELAQKRIPSIYAPGNFGGVGGLMPPFPIY
jgi:hypothetical protein